MSHREISLRQLQALLILNIFGTAVIGLPRVAAEFGGSDGWLIVIGAGFFALCYTFLINSLARLFPLEGFNQYSKRIIGRFLGGAISLLFVVRLIITAGLELRVFGEIIRQTVLYKTPIWATCGVMAILSAYLVCEGYSTRGRLAEILIYVVGLPLTLILAASIAKADPTNLLPLLKTPAINILTGSFYISFVFRGLELLLIAYPFVCKPLEIRKVTVRAVSFVGGTMAFVTAAAIMKFGPDDTKVQLWPVVQLVDTIRTPGGFFERLDAVVISIWMMAVLIAISAGIFFSAFMLEGRRDMRSDYILACGGLVFLVSMLPGNIVQTYKMLVWLDFVAGCVFMIFVPSILFIVARLRGVGSGDL